MVLLNIARTTRRQFLGWLHSVRGVPLEQLSFSAAIPSSQRAAVAVAFDYVQVTWLAEIRA